jgi:hypothetical protein
MATLKFGRIVSQLVFDGYRQSGKLQGLSILGGGFGTAIFGKVREVQHHRGVSGKSGYAVGVCSNIFSIHQSYVAQRMQVQHATGLCDHTL